jgi:predicted phosphodiesterase
MNRGVGIYPEAERRILYFVQQAAAKDECINQFVICGHTHKVGLFSIGGAICQHGRTQ